VGCRNNMGLSPSAGASVAGLVVFGTFTSLAAKIGRLR
jgi:hypothetical protein